MLVYSGTFYIYCNSLNFLFSYRLFDISANGVIQYKEVLEVMDMIREHSLKEKVYRIMIFTNCVNLVFNSFCSFLFGIKQETF